MNNCLITMIMVMSVDGIVVKEKEDVKEWTSKEDQQHLLSTLEKCDAVVTGINSFFGRVINKPYYVLTHNEEKLNNKEDPAVTYMNGTASEIIAMLNEKGYKKAALLGGPLTNQSFLAGNFVDDIYLTIENKMFGKGKHLTVEEELHCNLSLLEVERLNESGTLLLHYHVMKEENDQESNQGAPMKAPDVTDDELMQINREFWNERASLHEGSEYYDTEGIAGGKLSLVNYEIEELGDVNNKRLIHLQCHIGTDTVSLAELGAKVVGVDYSNSAVEIARDLAKKCGVDAEFICSDVYKVKEVLNDRKFDIAYVNFGAITMLPDLNKWASVIYDILEDDGYLYLNELHPVSAVLSVHEPTFVADYFAKEPRMFEESSSYAMGVDGNFSVETQNNNLIVWDRSLGEIISTIAANHFKIEYVHEFPGYVDQRFHYLEKGEDGLWYSGNGRPNTPATFSLKATKLKKQ